MSCDVTYYQNINTFSKALFDLAIGKPLGSGQFRDVFECRFDDSLVIKFQRNGGEFHNALEWEFWQEHKDSPDVAKWLAPCLVISASGDILVQKKTSFVKNWPKKVPNFLCDFKIGNFGMLGEQFVCHDYGFLYTKELRVGMTKVDWWSEK